MDTPFIPDRLALADASELIERFGRDDMEEVFLDMARGRGRGLDGLHKKETVS